MERYRLSVDGFGQLLESPYLAAVVGTESKGRLGHLEARHLVRGVVPPEVGIQRRQTAHGSVTPALHLYRDRRLVVVVAELYQLVSEGEGVNPSLPDGHLFLRPSVQHMR